MLLLLQFADTNLPLTLFYGTILWSLIRKKIPKMFQRWCEFGLVSRYILNNTIKVYVDNAALPTRH